MGFHFLILSSKVFIKFGLAYAWLDRCDPQSACTLSTLPVAGTRVLKDLPALVSIVVNDGVERAGESMKENDEIALRGNDDIALGERAMEVCNLYDLRTW